MANKSGFVQPLVDFPTSLDRCGLTEPPPRHGLDCASFGRFRQQKEHRETVGSPAQSLIFCPRNFTYKPKYRPLQLPLCGLCLVCIPSASPCLSAWRPSETFRLCLIYEDKRNPFKTLSCARVLWH